MAIKSLPGIFIELHEEVNNYEILRSAEDLQHIKDILKKAKGDRC